MIIASSIKDCLVPLVPIFSLLLGIAATAIALSVMRARLNAMSPEERQKYLEKAEKMVNPPPRAPKSSGPPPRSQRTERNVSERFQEPPVDAHSRSEPSANFVTQDPNLQKYNK